MKNLLFLLFILSALSSCTQLYYQTDFLVELDPDDYVNARDLGYSQNENGDLLIKYLIKNTSKKFIEECSKEYNRFSGGEFCRERVVTYKEGSLIMDIIDANTNEIVWHGAAYGPSFNDWKDADKKVNEMVGTLFQRYTTNTK